MLDPFDYKEPACALCGGEEFYNPTKKISGKVPTDRIIVKLDELLNRNDMQGAQKHLVFWLAEAEALNDARGQLTVINEFLGLDRKIGDKEHGLFAVRRALELIDEINIGDTVSGATIFLNAATTLKAFGRAQDALPLYARAEAVYDRDLPKNDARRAGLYNNRALAYADLARYEDAKREYLNAVDVLKSCDGDYNDVAITYVNLAHLLASTGDETAAKNSMDEAKTCLESEKIVRNGYHAYVCTKCAPSFEYFGYTEYAEILNKRAEALYAGN